MLSINKVMVTGRLTRDPETKYLPSGTAVTTLSVAVNRRFLDKKSNEWRDETTFLDVETWDKTAERCAEQLRKGRPVYVEGRVKQETWERDGQKHSKLRIVAERVTAFDVAGRSGEGAEASDEGEAFAPAGAPRQPRAAAPPQRPQSTGAPSDGLEFGDPGVQDDIPF